jgi:membrane protease YdiL (CAAX protease family)
MHGILTTPARPDTGLWKRIPLVIRAVLVGLLVTEVGIAVWGVFLATAPLPIALVATPALLVLYWLFFSGRIFWPTTMETRRENFRAVSLSPAIWTVGLGAAALFVVVLESSIFMLFRLIPYPAEQFEPLPMLGDVPTAWLWAAGIVASLVAGICEETGFRGYIQRPLELRYGPAVAIVITTAAFAALHLNQPWANTLLLPILLASTMLGALAYAARSLIPGIVGHAVMDVFNFAYWWWHLIGTYDKSTIFETGFDFDFAAWSATLAASLTLFVLAVLKLLALRQAPQPVDGDSPKAGPQRA